jgi:hypothetical protein
MRRKRLAPWLKGRQRRDVSYSRLAPALSVSLYLLAVLPDRRDPRMRGDHKDKG